MTKCVAFHSYKGGTGKSTISSNLSAALAKKGLTTVLLDVDVYAPSLQDYFQWQPKKSINDYLFENAEIDEVIHDLSTVLNKFPSNDGEQSDSSKGKLFVAFSSTSKDEIYKLDGAVRQEGSKIQLLRKFLMLREEIVAKYNADFIIIDTSPGIRYWSINSLAIADTILLSLKLDGIDLKGTRLLAKEIYESLTKLGTKSYLLLNRAAGYCLPLSLADQQSSSKEMYNNTVGNQATVVSKLNEDIGMDTILSIPCYCDIQFDSNEFLTALKFPDHPFAGKIDALIEKLKNI